MAIRNSPCIAKSEVISVQKATATIGGKQMVPTKTRNRSHRPEFIALKSARNLLSLDSVSIPRTTQELPELRRPPGGTCRLPGPTARIFFHHRPPSHIQTGRLPLSPTSAYTAQQRPRPQHSKPTAPAI